MKWIVVSIHLVLAIAASITLYFVYALKPSSTTAMVFFSLWLLIPHVIMSIILVLWRNKRLTLHLWYAVVIIVSVGGILMLSDVIFWHPDAQGAIAVVMVPLLQCATLVLAAPLCHWYGVRSYFVRKHFLRKQRSKKP